jgi:hypothetical protein
MLILYNNNTSLVSHLSGLYKSISWLKPLLVSKIINLINKK